MSHLVATKTGEGYDKPNAEAELPIDINNKKLVEWINTRQKLSVDWNKRLIAIQAKSAECFKDLKSELKAKLKGGSDAPVDYSKAVQIRDMLAQTAERTLFGGLTGEAATWDKIVKAYEKGAIHVGEASLALVQNVEFEIPFLRKQAAKARQVVEDAERRHADYLKSAASCAAAYKQECAALGIAGGPDVRGELRSMTANLGDLMSQLVATVQQQDNKLQQAIQYYTAFSQHAHDLKSDGSHDFVPTLREVKEDRSAEPSASIVAAFNSSATHPASSSSQQQLTRATGAKDTDTSASEPAAISWDFAVEDDTSGGAAKDAAQPVVDIAWDIDVSATATADAAADAGGGGGGVNIDWGIDLTAGGEASSGQGAGSGINWDLGPVEDAPSGSAGTSDDVLYGQRPVVRRLVMDGEYRACFLDDLLELRAFLSKRLSEVSGGGTQLLLGVLPEDLQSVDTKTLNAMQTCVTDIISGLKGQRMTELLLLSTSPRYMERLACNLERKAGQEGRMLSAATEAQARGNEAKVQLVEVARKVSDLVERSRAYKAHVESGLSALLGGRRVNILGEINTTLASTAA